MAHLQAIHCRAWQLLAETAVGDRIAIRHKGKAVNAKLLRVTPHHSRFAYVAELPSGSHFMGKITSILS